MNLGYFPLLFRTWAAEEAAFCLHALLHLPKLVCLVRFPLVAPRLRGPLAQVLLGVSLRRYGVWYSRCRRCVCRVLTLRMLLPSFASPPALQQAVQQRTYDDQAVQLWLSLVPPPRLLLVLRCRCGDVGRDRGHRQAPSTWGCVLPKRDGAPPRLDAAAPSAKDRCRGQIWVKQTHRQQQQQQQQSQ